MTDYVLGNVRPIKGSFNPEIVCMTNESEQVMVDVLIAFFAGFLLCTILVFCGILAVCFGAIDDALGIHKGW